MSSEKYESLLNSLKKRGFTPHFAQTGKQAAELALSLIGSCSTGCGGSMTVKNLGLYDALTAQGASIYYHGTAEPQKRAETMAKAASAEWYLASANAVTEDGRLMNIDGSGNRVAAMIFGPQKVLLIVGRNKIAPNLEAAYQRIKDVACPNNARRLGYSTPCAITGKCNDCSSPQRICSVITITERRPKAIGEFHIILVDEELGY